MEKKLILLSNDDGYDSEGIKILREYMLELGKVVVFAPSSERSASSHSITLRREILLKEVEKDIFAVEGTPVDSVLIGIYGVLQRKPDLVVSGINLGQNLGEDVFYSGTVAAAREGAMYGVPAMAVSLYVKREDKTKYYETAAHFARRVAKFLLTHRLNGELLNVNVPNLPLEKIKGVKFTRLSTRMYKDPVIKLRNSTYIIGGEPLWHVSKGTDLEAVLEGYVSISPLLIDITDYEKLGILRKFEKEIGGGTSER
uniref:5'-nucleotidase SurE n=1 Tax=candidate division WOR-3 bacterium TaxID=2052148 RepID=A0A7C2P1I4_UNCW3